MMRRLVPSLAAVMALLSVCAQRAAAAPANSCVFTVSMTSGVDLNNLDFTVNYTNTDSILGGEPNHPDCVRALGGTFVGFHDDQVGHLRASLIRLSHFSATVPLAACRLLYDTTPPATGQFSITVQTAARDGEDVNVDPLPTLAVTKVECPGELPEVTTTTTTLPEVTTTTLAGSGVCGVPASGGDSPTASDALFALKAAVGGASCPLCECDINNDGQVGAGDALGILRAAVGAEVSLNCPAC